MQRDLPSILQPRRRFSEGSSARFFYLAEKIARVYEPTATQLEDLDRAYNSTGDYLATCSEFEGMLYRVHAHGSRQLGTMVRPIDECRTGYDIDLAACLETAGMRRYGGPQGPALLIEHLYAALKRYADRYGLSIVRHERCVTMTYAGGMTADFAPIIDDPSNVVMNGESHASIPDRDLQEYISTNPRGYCKAFDTIARIEPVFERVAIAKAMMESIRNAELVPLPEPDEVFSRLLSRLVQLVKIHRNIEFGQLRSTIELSPPSSFITTLVANAYAIAAPQMHDGPMDLLLDIVQLMPKMFVRMPMQGGAEFWHLNNPTARNDNLAACMNTIAKQKAFDAWHVKLQADLLRIVDAVDQQAGLDVIAKAVAQAFGERAKTGVIEDNAARREAQRSAGRGLFIAGGSAAIYTPSRAHTNFGD